MEDDTFGARVSSDATGEDGSEPGVDGPQIAEEAKANGEADDVGTADTDDDDDEGGPDGTPGEAAVDTFRPSDDD